MGLDCLNKEPSGVFTGGFHGDPATNNY